LLENSFPKVPRVVLDPIIDVEGARGDPDLFLNNRRSPLILDEIQYAPELVPAIKRRLERDKSPGQYLITGSQQWDVMRLLKESLAGRAILLDLHGFSLSEIYKKDFWLKSWLEGREEFKKMGPSVRPLFEQLWRGFFPQAQFIEDSAIPYFYQSYITTCIEKDVRNFADVENWELFGRFYRLCAALTAQEINHSQLGREIGVKPQTASRWLEILKATFQWNEIPAFSQNAVKRVSTRAKGYFLDTGLVSSALAISSIWGAASIFRLPLKAH
jgi:predicted AAA+ superfamily ATPase